MNWKGCINLKIECKSYEIYVNSIEQIQKTDSSEIDSSNQL